MVLIAELLCGLKKGGIVELTLVTGIGFEIDQIESPENYPMFLIFTTGSGVRSLIASGFNGGKGSDVKLFYGARNLDKMAYQDNRKPQLEENS